MNIDTTLANFRELGNIPLLNDKFIRVDNGIHLATRQIGWQNFPSGMGCIHCEPKMEKQDLRVGESLRQNSSSTTSYIQEQQTKRNQDMNQER